MDRFFDTANLAPYGLCLGWRPELLWLALGGDALIGLASLSIPLALACFVWRRRDLAFGWMIWLFAAFILAAGLTHGLAIWTLWHADHAAAGLAKLVVGLLSVSTAALVWPLVPRATALPSPAALRRVNEQLLREVRERDRAVEALHQETLVRQRAEAQLRQAQKMEALGQLTGGVAHDFNNLLAIIQGNIETLQRQVPVADERLRRPIESALHGAERAAALTHRLLAFSRRQALNPEPVYVNDLVEGMCELLRQTFERIEIDCVLAEGLGTVFADANQLENAILNLAVNARDAMPEGGLLTLETSDTWLDEAYAAHHADVTAGPYVVIAVHDSGTGMSKAIMAKAVEPFFTTKESGQGTGLGLSQVYGFVKQSGGHLKIYSELGHGTTVKIYLPRRAAPDAPPLDATAARRFRVAGAGAVTLLVVAGDDDLRGHAVEMLRELGYRVLEARDAAAALAILDREPSVGLILADLHLPGTLDGRALAAAARQRRPGLTLLFTAAAPGEVEPALPVIGKPLTYATLAQRIRQALGLDAAA